jgi:hypothetical protein
LVWLVAWVMLAAAPAFVVGAIEYFSATGDFAL